MIAQQPARWQFVHTFREIDMRAHAANNIGFLRLCFASLVILGHAPEMVDGDRTREPLTWLFHTLSLGEVSVDAFFLLSGYLITKSMLKTDRFAPFMERRVLRIYPAFLLSYVICVFILGPLVGANISTDIVQTLLNMVMLKPPVSYPGQFSGLTTYPVLNGAMWTIAHEFRCYIVIGLLGVSGLLRRRRLFLILTTVALALSVLATWPAVFNALQQVGHNIVIRFAFDSPNDVVRLTPIFMVGSCWFLFEKEINDVLAGWCALVCFGISLCLLYHDRHFAEVFLVTIGGVSLYWLSFKARLGILQTINDRWDISYGTYLYAWPIAITIVWKNPGMSPWGVAMLTLPSALLAGAVSWFGLERWTKDLVRSKSTGVGQQSKSFSVYPTLGGTQDNLAPGLKSGRPKSRVLEEFGFRLVSGITARIKGSRH